MAEELNSISADVYRLRIDSGQPVKMTRLLGETCVASLSVVSRRVENLSSALSGQSQNGTILVVDMELEVLDQLYLQIKQLAQKIGHMLPEPDSKPAEFQKVVTVGPSPRGGSD